MADLIITERSNIVALADAIREKTGSTDNITLGDMISDIEVNIKSNPVLQNKEIIPTTETQVVTADGGYDGLDTVTINGDTNLKAENIAEGISIFGVEGTYSGEGSNVEGIVETCTVSINCFNTIQSCVYTAYENGEVVPKGSTSVESNSFTCDNILCGSAIHLNNSYNMNGYTCTGGVEVFRISNLIGGCILRAPTVPGALGTIDIYDND